MGKFKLELHHLKSVIWLAFFLLTQFKSPCWHRFRGSKQVTDSVSKAEVVRNWLWFLTSDLCDLWAQLWVKMLHGLRSELLEETIKAYWGFCLLSNQITADWYPTRCYWHTLSLSLTHTRTHWDLACWLTGRFPVSPLPLIAKTTKHRKWPRPLLHLPFGTEWSGGWWWLPMISCLCLKATVNYTWDASPKNDFIFRKKKPKKSALCLVGPVKWNLHFELFTYTHLHNEQLTFLNHTHHI